MSRTKIYMQIFNFKKLFAKLFMKNKQTKLLPQYVVGYLPKTY